jgi:Flp pilus assembly protein TadD
LGILCCCGCSFLILVRHFAEAIECYEQAAAVEPENAEVHTAHGLTMQLAGQTEHAIESYHTALTLYPNHPIALEMLSIAVQELAEHTIGC